MVMILVLWKQPREWPVPNPDTIPRGLPFEGFTMGDVLKESIKLVTVIQMLVAGHKIWTVRSSCLLMRNRRKPRLLQSTCRRPWPQSATT